MNFYAKEREAMVASQIAHRGVKDARVLEAMRKVPRHEFVPEGFRDFAYTDQPLPIGKDQTISQPYIVALMTEMLALESARARLPKGEKLRVLEIGTGSGYQAAVLAERADEVYSIEYIGELAERAKETLSRLGYVNVSIRTGDGYYGWPEESPFDGIILTAAPVSVPPPLFEQLKVGGRLVAPVGDFFQELVVIERTEEGYKEYKSIPVRFVPMQGAAENRKNAK